MQTRTREAVEGLVRGSMALLLGGALTLLQGCSSSGGAPGPAAGSQSSGGVTGGAGNVTGGSLAAIGGRTTSIGGVSLTSGGETFIGGETVTGGATVNGGEKLAVGRLVRAQTVQTSRRARGLRHAGACSPEWFAAAVSEELGFPLLVDVNHLGGGKAVEPGRGGVAVGPYRFAIYQDVQVQIRQILRQRDGVQRVAGLAEDGADFARSALEGFDVVVPDFGPTRPPKDGLEF